MSITKSIAEAKAATSRTGVEVVSVRDVRKTYSLGETEVQALRGISVSIDAGDFVAIMGASGSGKSTLMNILGRDWPVMPTIRLEPGINYAR